MLPVARRPITSQLSTSVACVDRQHENPWLVRSLDHSQRVDVRAVLDARRKAPRTAEQVAAIVRDRGARARALTDDHRQAVAAEELSDCGVPEVRGAGSNRERGSHQDPAGGGIAVRQALDDLQRRHGIELGAAANRSRHPHAEQAFAVKRLDDGLRQLTVLVAPVRVLVGERCDFSCTIEETGSLRHGGYFTCTEN